MWHINILGDCGLALLDRTVHVHVLDLLAEVCSHADQSNQAIFDLELDICSFFDVLNKGTDSLDGKRLATVTH